MYLRSAKWHLQKIRVLNVNAMEKSSRVSKKLVLYFNVRLTFSSHRPAAVARNAPKTSPTLRLKVSVSRSLTLSVVIEFDFDFQVVVWWWGISSHLRKKRKLSQMCVLRVRVITKHPFVLRKLVQCWNVHPNINSIDRTNVVPPAHRSLLNLSAPHAPTRVSHIR